MKKVTIIIILFFCSTVKANLLIVDSNEDVIQVDNNCTLREALTAANFDISVDQCGTGLGDDLIWLLISATDDAIQLDNQLPIIDGVTIQGPGVDSLVLFPTNGNNGHAFQINTDRDVTFQDFRVGGFEDSAIDVVNVRDLELTNMKLVSNSAGGIGTFGGAIQADLDQGPTQSISEMIINDTEFQGNSAGNGGALAISGQYPVSISNSSFTQNSAITLGGAIYRYNNDRNVFNASIDISNSQFDNNSSNTFGGAIAIDLTYMNIDAALFHQNSGQNVIYISRSVATVQNSLFAANPVNRTILHKNFSSSPIFTELSLSFNTFLDTQNLHLENSSSGATLTTYLKANVFDNNNAFKCQGTGNVSLGENVESIGSSCSSGVNDFPATDPLLLDLDTYGGELLIAPPSPISPLVDAGSGCTSTDLSGEGRTRDGNADSVAECDIGAIERPDAFNLNVSTTGSGDGQINLNEFDLVCYSPDSCDWPLEKNQVYAFQAIPDSGNTFDQWSGACSGSSACNVTMNSSSSLSAEFSVIPSSVTLNINTFRSEPYLNATVTSDPLGISCGETCSFDFEENDTVVLTASPQSDTVVDYWDGCDIESNDGLQCTVFLGSQNVTIEMHLDKNPDIVFKGTFDTP